MSRTIAILIGNSDDKLSQAQWSRFVSHVRHIACRCGELQFDGQPAGDQAYQNACIVISEVNFQRRKMLDQRLRVIAMQFGQASIAVVSGETTFLKPDTSLCRTYPIRVNVALILWPHCDQWWTIDCCMSFELEARHG